MKRFSLASRNASSLTNHLWLRLRRPLLLIALVFTGTANAYVLEGQRWFSSPVFMQMNLSATSYHLQSPPAFPLIDGAASWETVYSASAAIWNQYMANLQINAYASKNSNGGQTGDSVNEAFFGSSLGGSTLDSNTLGLTIYSYNPSTNAMVEADTAFNPSILWNSYRGPLLSSGVIDFRRVAIHELGHILGLDHPDTNGQTVNAIMNSVIGNIETVTADDIAGVQAPYGAPANPPPKGIPPASTTGAGQAELVWENTTTGERSIWVMQYGVLSSIINLPTIPIQWHIAAAADFLGTGQADLVWENTTTGERNIWVMQTAHPSTLSICPLSQLSGASRLQQTFSVPARRASFGRIQSPASGASGS
jgi:hypothetical protein